MHQIVFLGMILLLVLPLTNEHEKRSAGVPVPTREFEIREDRAYLGGKPIQLWGLRCGNALHSPAITERHIRNLDNMAAHGINCLGVYIQGSNGGWPDANAALNGFTRDGKLKPAVAERLRNSMTMPPSAGPWKRRPAFWRSAGFAMSSSISFMNSAIQNEWIKKSSGSPREPPRRPN